VIIQKEQFTQTLLVSEHFQSSDQWPHWCRDHILVL